MGTKRNIIILESLQVELNLCGEMLNKKLGKTGKTEKKKEQLK
jgi:hypothetical protein